MGDSGNKKATHHAVSSGPPVLPLQTPSGSRQLARPAMGTPPPGTMATLAAPRLRAPSAAHELMRSLRDTMVVMGIAGGATCAALLFTEAARNELFKLFAATYFSLLPAFLYLQFMAVRGPTLWEEFTENLYRLRFDDPVSLPRPLSHCRYYRLWQAANAHEHDPASKTLYQKKFEGVFGAIPIDDKIAPALHREKLAPVIMATVLFSVAWVMVVMPAPILDLLLFHDPVAPRFSPSLPIETVRFGFLGAYFYAVQMLVRRYFQNDLKTSAYLNATMRVVIVVLLTWTVDLGLTASAGSEPTGAVYSQAFRSMLAFVIGVFPDVGWKAIQELIKVPIRPLVPSLRQPYPLADLDGLNVWYEARLLEEGLEDMQNLATCNLVDVMLNTRIPVERLVDWIDQSILYLHLGTENGKDASGARERLRRYGIRTATDLEEALTPRSSEPVEQDRVARLERLLNTADSEPSMLRTILATFQSEPNLQYVRAWRADRPMDSDGWPVAPSAGR